ncbi:MAG: helix-turn-helix transcriptional regulator [Opitutales bacterium]
MHYTEFFRRLREEKKLTHGALAARASCHRNTVLNVERNRPVKFQTILDLMEAMGHSPDSKEVKRMALLWLEAVTGVSMDLDAARIEARQVAIEYGRTIEGDIGGLTRSIYEHALPVDQIRLLEMAVRQPEIMEILRQVRNLIALQGGRQGSREGDSRQKNNLRVAEEKDEP